MILYTWEENEHPVCPKCQRSTLTFRPYKKDVLKLLHLTLPNDKIVAVGKCLWDCEIEAIIPLSWLNTKLLDPNNVIKEWKCVMK